MKPKIHPGIYELKKQREALSQRTHLFSTSLQSFYCPERLMKREVREQWWPGPGHEIPALPLQMRWDAPAWSKQALQSHQCLGFPSGTRLSTHPFSGKKSKILCEWTQTHPESDWWKKASANAKSDFPSFQLYTSNPTGALPSLTKYLGQIHVKKWKMGDLPRFMVQSSAQSDVWGCCIPRNHAVVHWGLGWGRRPVQVLTAAHTACFGKS